MGIVVRHEAVGIPLRRDNSRFNAGMQMVQRQQERDQQMRNSQVQPLKYNTGGTYGGVGISSQKKKADPALLQQPQVIPSWQETNEAIMSNIQAGMYDNETSRALSDIVNRQNRLMTNERLSNAQKEDAFNRFEMDKRKLETSVGSFLAGPAQRAAQRNAPPSFAQYYNDPDKFNAAFAKKAEELGDNPDRDAVIKAMESDYAAWEDLMRRVPGRRYGGSVHPGQTVVVGEEGPEMMRVGHDGVAQVTPNPATMARMQGSMANRKRMNALETFRAKPEVYKDYLSRADVEADKLGVALSAQQRMQRAKELWEMEDAFLNGQESPTPTRDIGGIVVPGEEYMVGGRGPEVLQMGQNGGYVIPNSQLGFANQQQGMPMNPAATATVQEDLYPDAFGQEAILAQPAAPQASPVVSSQMGAAESTQPTQPKPQVATPRSTPTPAPSQTRDPLQPKQGRKGYRSFAPTTGSVTVSGRTPIYNEQGNFVGDPSLYDSAGAKNIRQQAGLEAPPSAMRKWTSNDGKYSAEGEVVSYKVTPGGDPVTNETVRIRKSDGQEVDVPIARLSDADRALITKDPRYIYAASNQNLSSTYQMFDPNNPDYAARATPSQNQQQEKGKFKGTYGLGGVDYGINEKTGNRVTGSIRPGGTTIEYDEPVKVRPKITNQSIDEAMTRAGRAKRQQASQEFDSKYPNAARGTVNIPSSVVAPATASSSPTAFDKNAPENVSAINVALNPNTSEEDKRKAAITLMQNGATEEDIAQIEKEKPQSRPKTVYQGRSGIPQGVDKRPATQSKQQSKLATTPKPTEKNIKESIAYLQSGAASAPEKEILTEFLRSNGVDVNNIVTPAPPAEPNGLPANTTKQNANASVGKTDKQLSIPMPPPPVNTEAKPGKGVGKAVVEGIIQYANSLQDKKLGMKIASVYDSRVPLDIRAQTAKELLDAGVDLRKLEESIKSSIGSIKTSQQKSKDARIKYSGT